MQEEKLRHTRLIAYSAQIGSHLDPKKLPRSIDQFMPIGNEKNSVKSNKNDNFDDMKELFKKRMQEYRSQQNN